MKKVVFFSDLNKLHDAVENFNIQSFSDKEIPVKLHMGEVKNKYFPKPDFVKLVIDELKMDLVDLYEHYRNIKSEKLGDKPGKWKKILCDKIDERRYKTFS